MEMDVLAEGVETTAQADALRGAQQIRAYVESVEGTRTGEILDVRDFRENR